MIVNESILSFVSSKVRSPLPALASLLLVTDLRAAPRRIRPRLSRTARRRCTSSIGSGSARPRATSTGCSRGASPATSKEQLHPDRIPDSRVAWELAALPTIRMADADMVMDFERPLQNARKVAVRSETRRRLPGPQSGGFCMYFVGILLGQ